MLYERMLLIKGPNPMIVIQSNSEKIHSYIMSDNNNFEGLLQSEINGNILLRYTKRHIYL